MERVANGSLKKFGKKKELPEHVVNYVVYFTVENPETLIELVPPLMTAIADQVAEAFA